MEMLSTLLPCFPISRKKPAISLPLEKGFPVEKSINYPTLSEKLPFSPPTSPSYPTITVEDAATSIVSIIQNADEAGRSLHNDIQSIVHQAGGWSEYLAKHVLWGLEAVLRAGKEMNAVLKEAYDKACEAAKAIEGFAAEHPVATAVFCTIVALGVLVIVAPYVIETLGFWVGFAEEGPVAGMFRYCSWEVRRIGAFANNSGV